MSNDEIRKTSEVADWKHHPITMEFFLAIEERIKGLKDEIAGSAHTEEPRVLAFKAGAIQAFSDVLDVDI